MHVAFLVRKMESGGAERAAAALVSQFASLGHTATLFVLLGRTSFYTLHENVQVVYLQPNDASEKFGTVQRAAKLRKLLRNMHPDVLVGMSPFMSAYAAICSAGLHTAAVGTERANPFILYADRRTTLLRKITSLLCKGFVCQTEKALSFFPSSVRRKAAVIPNAVFNPLVYDTSVPNEREKVITALGRLDHNKGFDVLLRAFALIRAEMPDYTLTIYGEGEERDALHALALQLNVAPYVSMPGNRSDAILQIARSSVFVLSSRSEGMPNALLEAMASGTPCVSSRCEIGPEELISDGENGLLVPVEDAAALSDAVLRILRDDALSAFLSRHALSIRRTHDIGTITDQWLRYFRLVSRA